MKIYHLFVINKFAAELVLSFTLESRFLLHFSIVSIETGVKFGLVSQN